MMRGAGSASHEFRLSFGKVPSACSPGRVWLQLPGAPARICEAILGSHKQCEKSHVLHVLGGHVLGGHEQ